MNEKLLSKFIGLPYKIDGRDSDGIDCIGIVWKFLHEQGYQVELHAGCTEEWLKNKTYDEWLALVKSYGEPIDINGLQENDILYFAWKDEIHAGIYIGYNRYLHITDKSRSHISRLNNAAKERVVAIMRPSLSEKKILPPAGKTALQAVATVVGAFVGGIIGFICMGPAGVFPGMMIGGSMGYTMFAPEVGELGPSGDLDNSPKYKFGGLKLTRSSEIPSALIYGRNKVSGNVIYSKISTDGLTAWQLIGLGEGEIEYIESLKVNNENLTDFSNCTWNGYTGTSTQLVDSRADNCYGLRHLAYVACTFSASEKLPQLPSKVVAIVRGLKVQTWNGSVWSYNKTYSNNPAACIRDYLIRSRELGGCGILTTNIDEASFGEVYDYCNVTISNGAGSTEKRFEFSYVIDTKRSAIDNLTEMIATFGGFLIITGTTIKVCMKKPSISSSSFDMNNIKTGSFQYSYIPKDNQINRVGVQYVDINQEDTRPIAYVDDFIDQDERGVYEKIFPMYGIGRMSQALRLAWQILYDLKINPIVCAFETDIWGMNLEPGDVISISHDVPNWVNKEFLVYAIEEKENNEYSISALAYNSTIYNDTYGSGIMIYNNGAPPNPYDSPPDLTVFNIDSDGTNIVFSWDKVSNTINVQIAGYEIREGTDWDTGTVIAGLSAETTSYRSPIRYSGIRTFMIKAKSTYGIYSLNELSDSITITKVSGQNLILEEFLWQYLLQGACNQWCQLIWTTNYNPAYYRLSIGVKTVTTWEDYETMGLTWDQIEAYTWDIPVTTNEAGFTFPWVDLTSIFTLVPTDISTIATPNMNDIDIKWLYKTV